MTKNKKNNSYNPAGTSTKQLEEQSLRDLREYLEDLGFDPNAFATWEEYEDYHEECVAWEYEQYKEREREWIKAGRPDKPKAHFMFGPTNPELPGTT